MKDFDVENYCIDEEGYFFYVPERLICCSLEKHNALVKATKEIEEMDSNVIDR